MVISYCLCDWLPLAPLNLSLSFGLSDFSSGAFHVGCSPRWHFQCFSPLGLLGLAVVHVCVSAYVHVPLGACRGHERSLDWGLQAVLLTDVVAENYYAQIHKVPQNPKRRLSPICKSKEPLF